MISLREAREQKGLTVTELAAAVGVDATQIEAIESGQERVSTTLALKLSAALGKPIKEVRELAAQMTGLLGAGADPLLGPRIRPRVGP